MRILFVTQKPSMTTHFRDMLSKTPAAANSDHSYLFVCANLVMHIDDRMCNFRCKDGLIMQGSERIKDWSFLDLISLDVPAGTFMESHVMESHHAYAMPGDIHSFDMIIGITDPDIEGVLMFKKFVENHGVKNPRWITVKDPCSDEEMAKLAEPTNSEDFEKDVWPLAVKHLTETSFKSSYPCTNDVMKLRRELQWTRRDLSNYFKIPYRTVENWENRVNECPQYLYDLMVYKLKSEGCLK